MYLINITETVINLEFCADSGTVDRGWRRRKRRRKWTLTLQERIDYTTWCAIIRAIKARIEQIVACIICTLMLGSI